MERIFRRLAFICLITVCGTALRSTGLIDDTEYLPDNAPDGAIEYFESDDAKSSIALLEDRVEIKGFEGMPQNDMTMLIADISRVKRHGTDIKIEARDGTWVEFSLNLFSRKAATEFTDELNDLIKHSPK